MTKMLTKFIVKWLNSRDLVAVNERELECTESELERHRRAIDPMSRFGTERLIRLNDSGSFDYFSVSDDVAAYFVVFFVGFISGLTATAIGKGF